MQPKTQYLTDDKGKKVAVLLPLKKYNKMMEELEELEDIKAYDKVMKSNPEFIPFDKAVKEIEAKRKKK